MSRKTLSPQMVGMWPSLMTLYLLQDSQRGTLTRTQGSERPPACPLCTWTAATQAREEPQDSPGWLVPLVSPWTQGSQALLHPHAHSATSEQGGRQRWPCLLSSPWGACSPDPMDETLRPPLTAVRRATSSGNTEQTRTTVTMARGQL